MITEARLVMAVALGAVFPPAVRKPIVETGLPQADGIITEHLKLNILLAGSS
jgi:hypothetical protein